MKKVTHIRRDHRIYTVDGALFKDCGSINAAKEMCRLQQKPGVKDEDRWVVRAEKVDRPKVKVKPLPVASKAELRRKHGGKHNWRTSADD